MGHRLRLTALCVLGSLLGGCERSVRPNVLLIVVDTLRADRLGSYGHRGGLTPFLDGLAAQGTVFLHAYSTTSYTEPAVASLFTSRYPSQHRVVKFETKVADAELTLAEELEQAGYVTAGFSANFLLSEPRGYGQGFQLWQSTWTEKVLKIRGPVIRRAAIGWVDRAHDALTERPKFLYLQYMEPHAPYEPPDRYMRHEPSGAKLMRLVAAAEPMQADAPAASDAEVERQKSLYDGEVAELDNEIRLAFEQLDQRGFLEHAIVIITADHGEAFNEHGYMGHDRTLFNELIRVPLIVVAPGCGNGAVEENVSLVDIAPTVIELVGLPVPAAFTGRSLVPLLHCGSRWRRMAAWVRAAGFFGEEPNQARPSRAPGVVLVELESRNSKFDFRLHSAGVIHDSKKLLLGIDGTHELYDLASDPRELKPDRDGDGGALKETLATTRTQLQAPAGPAAQGPAVDEATKEKLRALGYNP